MGAREMERFLEQSHMDARDLRRRLILSPKPRERERWYTLWLLSQGWTASAAAQALERDPHPIGRWLSARRGRGSGFDFRADGCSSRAPRRASGVEGSGRNHLLRQASAWPTGSGGWAISLSRDVMAPPEPQQLLELPAPSCPEAAQETARQADERKRESFVAEYADLADGAPVRGQDILWTRPTSGPPTAGQVSVESRADLGGSQQPARW